MSRKCEVETTQRPIPLKERVPGKMNPAMAHAERYRHETSFWNSGCGLVRWACMGCSAHGDFKPAELGLKWDMERLIDGNYEVPES